MGFNCGIVGLPNVGKSTLFNALTESAAADAANYPFCTIEPNTGRVAVPDPRLEKLAGIATSQQVIPTQLEFVDIAGLVRGASKGEGLGNQFLANIREVDAIIHVLRCFDDDNAKLVARAKGGKEYNYNCPHQQQIKQVFDMFLHVPKTPCQSGTCISRFSLVHRKPWISSLKIVFPRVCDNYVIWASSTEHFDF